MKAGCTIKSFGVQDRVRNSDGREKSMDKPSYKAFSHRLRSTMRNDRQGRRFEIEEKDCARGEGKGEVGTTILTA